MRIIYFPATDEKKPPSLAELLIQMRLLAWLEAKGDKR